MNTVADWVQSGGPILGNETITRISRTDLPLNSKPSGSKRQKLSHPLEGSSNGDSNIHDEELYGNLSETPETCRRYNFIENDNNSTDVESIADDDSLENQGFGLDDTYVSRHISLEENITGDRIEIDEYSEHHDGEIQPMLPASAENPGISGVRFSDQHNEGMQPFLQGLAETVETSHLPPQTQTYDGLIINAPAEECNTHTHINLQSTWGSQGVTEQEQMQSSILQTDLAASTPVPIEGNDFPNNCALVVLPENENECMLVPISLLENQTWSEEQRVKRQTAYIGVTKLAVNLLNELANDSFEDHEIPNICLPFAQQLLDLASSYNAGVAGEIPSDDNHPMVSPEQNAQEVEVDIQLNRCYTEIGPESNIHMISLSALQNAASKFSIKKAVVALVECDVFLPRILKLESSVKRPKSSTGKLLKPLDPRKLTALYHTIADTTRMPNIRRSTECVSSSPNYLTSGEQDVVRETLSQYFNKLRQDQKRASRRVLRGRQ